MHFLLLYSLFHWGTNNSEKVLVTQLCPTPLPLEELWPTRFLCPWDSPGKNTWVVCHSFLQGIFLTQGSNPGLPHCKQTLYYLSHQGSPGIYIYPLAFEPSSCLPPNPNPLSWYRAPVWVPWVMQPIPIGYPFYIYILQSPSSPHPMSISLFPMSVSPMPCR